jgi:hypothetical protein
VIASFDSYQGSLPSAFALGRTAILRIMVERLNFANHMQKVVVVVGSMPIERPAQSNTFQMVFAHSQSKREQKRGENVFYESICDGQ